MIKSKFAKRDNSFKAQKIFTDRVEPRKVFTDSISSFASEDETSKTAEIVVYYGKGGIGKTSLLRKLKKDEDKVYCQYSKYKFNSVFISLDAFDYSNPVNILLAIRDKVDGDCSLFDYAMLQYTAKAKFTIDEIMSKHDILSSPIMDVLNEVISMGTLSACIPTNALRKAVSIIKDQALKRKYKEEIEEMDSLSESELFERLPYYLGLCIANAAEKNSLHVIYFDSYESLLARTDSIFCSAADEWLKELFISSERIRMVIASRDRIQWDYQDPDWGEYLNQHLLKNLSDEDSRWFLESVPIKDANAIKAIVKNAGGVPLYLDMCVNMFEADKNNDEEFVLDAETYGEKIIDRYTRHLSDKEKSAIRVLSFLGCFDIRHGQELLKRSGISYEKNELEHFMRRSIFVPIDKKHKIWNMDKSVSEHQISLLSDEEITDVVKSLIEMIKDNPKGDRFKYFDNIILIIANKPGILKNVIEEVLYLIEIYGTAGYWNELHTRLSQHIDCEYENVRALAVYSEIIYLRRTGNLAEEQKFIEEHILEKKTIGKAYYMYKYFVIQNRHLQGYYDEALDGYKKLLKRMNLVKQLIPLHTYMMVSMKYADLLFLKGQFDESLSNVEKLLSVSNNSIADMIELMRIKGHIYRFRQQYTEAEIIYTAALKLAEDNHMLSYEGKLYTNLTETLCVSNPSAAFEWFEKAKEVNESVDNEIELGKAYAALSVAYTNSSEYDVAVESAMKGIEYAEHTGYKSGKAFALISLYYAFAKKNDSDSRKRIYEELKDIMDKIGVYGYLMDRVKEYEDNTND